jgi:hypothetical protein
VTRLERACWAVAALLALSGLVHVVVLLATGGPWTGPVSWRKPATFGLSFGLTVATVAWVSRYLGLRERTRDLLLGLFTAASGLEVMVITVQAWRRVPSHFNTTTPLNAAFAYAAAAGGATLVALSAGLAVAAVRGSPTVPRPMRLALRVGVGSFLLTLLVGAAMIARGVIAGRTLSQAAAYASPAPLKPAHAALMHGVLVLPLVAWWAGRRPWSERRRLQVVGAACGLYLLLAALVAVGVLPLPLG